jgi:site-specific recombinase XerD
MDTTHDHRRANLTTGADHKGVNRPLELLDENEIRLLDEAMRTSHRTVLGYRNRLAVRLMAGAGLRISEVLSLTPASIDPMTGNIRVTGKGGKTRITRLPAADMPLLRSWIKRRPDGATMLVCRQDGSPMEASAMRQTIKRAAARAGIRKEVRCHSFRHRFAVTLANDNVPVPHISRLLGHSSVATTQHYLAGLSLEDALDALTERVTV